MVRHQIRRFGGFALRLLAALTMVASLGLAAAGGGRGVGAQEAGLATVPGENVPLVSDLAVAQVAGVVGQDAYVAAEALSYRAGPGLDAAVRDLLPFGTTGVITDGPVTADDYTWFEFDVDGYGDAPGWVAGEFLATVDGALAAETADSSLVPGSEGIVALGELHLRVAPGLSGGVLAALPLGMRVALLEGPVAADGYTWYRVQIPGQASEGWVAGEFLAPSPGVSATFALGDAVVIDGDGLNLRAAPALTGDAITQLAIGTEATVTGGPLPADGYWWYQIALDGTTPSGWVVADFLAYP